MMCRGGIRHSVRVRRAVFSSYLLLLVAFRAHADVSKEPDWPAFLVAVPPTLETILVADTSDARLYAYRLDPDGGLEASEHYMSIGQHGTGKQRAGDRRTPLGVYFITGQLDTERLHEKYGITAFPMDYPNVLDRQAGRSGDGIWLHGVERGGGQRPERDTDGCLALPNADLAELSSAITPNETPVVIAASMRYAPREGRAELAAEFEQRLLAWQEAQARRDVLAYAKLYAEDFRYRGLDREAWLGFRARQLDANAGGNFGIADILVIEDPVNSGLYISRFRLVPDGAAGRSKRLYWRRGADGLMRIVAEDNG